VPRVVVLARAVVARISAATTSTTLSSPIALVKSRSQADVGNIGPLATLHAE